MTTHKRKIDRLQRRLGKLTEDVYEVMFESCIEKMKTERDLKRTWVSLDLAKYQLDDAFRTLK